MGSRPVEPDPVNTAEGDGNIALMIGDFLSWKVAFFSLATPPGTRLETGVCYVLRRAVFSLSSDRSIR